MDSNETEPLTENDALIDLAEWNNRQLVLAGLRPVLVPSTHTPRHRADPSNPPGEDRI
jgi:hypothetical protein